MSTPITGQKTDRQIDAMRQGGKILAQIFADIKQFAKPGVSEQEVDNFVEKKILEYGAEVTYKTSEVGFPGAICISTNNEIVHGIPTDRVFVVGDLVSFDLVITYKGMKVDAAFTMVMGAEPKGAVKHLLKNTERSLYSGIEAIHGTGTRVGDISDSVGITLSSAKLGIVRELVGHGVGIEMHMPPDIPNYGKKRTGEVLLAGDTIAIEPMATLGSEKIISLDDGWTIATADSSLAAHFEHTVLITDTGFEILTK